MASNAPPENGEQAPPAPPAATVTAATAPAASHSDVPTSNGNPNGPVPAPLPEGRMPTRKDASLKEFLTKMDDYAPIIPDAVTNYYMTRAGLPPPPQTDARLAKLLALATQKFVADIAADAYQYSRMRASTSASANNPMGNLGAAAGFPIPGQQPGGGGGQAGGQPGQAGAGGGKDAAGGGAAGARGPLGIQRAGYGGGGQGGSQNRTVLTMEDLGMAVGEYGVNLKRSEFYR